MKNLKCLYINIYSSDNQFVYQRPSAKREGAPAQPSGEKEPRLAALIPPPRSALETTRKAAEEAAERAKLPKAKETPAPAGPPVSEAEKVKQAVEAAKGKGKAAKKTLPPGELAIIPELEDISKLDKATISRMPKEQKQEAFLRDTPPYGKLVDFQNNKTALRMIGLRDLYDKNTSFLIVKKVTTNADVYVEREKDGHYYDSAGNKMTIKTGDIIRIPQGKELADFQETAKKEKEALARQKRQFREEFTKYIISLYVTPEKGWEEKDAKILAEALLQFKKYPLNSTRDDWEKKESKDFISRVAIFWNDEYKQGRLTEINASALATKFREANKPQPRGEKGEPSAPEESEPTQMEIAALKEKFKKYIFTIVGSSLDDSQITTLANALLVVQRYSPKSTEKDWENDRALFLKVYGYYMKNQDSKQEVLVVEARKVKRPKFDRQTGEEIPPPKDAVKVAIKPAAPEKGSGLDAEKAEEAFQQAVAVIRLESGAIHVEPGVTYANFIDNLTEGQDPYSGTVWEKVLRSQSYGKPSGAPEPAAPRVPAEPERAEAVAKAPAKPEAERRKALDEHFQKEYTDINEADRRVLVKTIFTFNKHFDIDQAVHQNVLKIAMEKFSDQKRRGLARKIDATLLAILSTKDSEAQDKYIAELRKKAEEYALKKNTNKDEVNFVMDAIFNNKNRDKRFVDVKYDKNERLIVQCMNVHRKYKNLSHDEMLNTAERYERILDYMATLGLKNEERKQAFLEMLLKTDRDFNVNADENKKLMKAYVDEYNHMEKNNKFEENATTEIAKWENVKKAYEEGLQTERLAGRTEVPPDQGEGGVAVAQADTTK